MLVGVDVGGTFTDFVAALGTDVRTRKFASSPSDSGARVLAGLRELGGTEMAHGTTVATNAVLQGRGLRVGFVTTEGFEDLLVIARPNRPSLYDFRVTRPEPLVPEERRFAVRERVAADGSVIKNLDPKILRDLVFRIRESGVESVAVCLLFSFLYPQHERAVLDALSNLPVRSAWRSIGSCEVRGARACMRAVTV